MPVNTDPIETILRAFTVGNQIRQQREQLEADNFNKSEQRKQQDAALELRRKEQEDEINFRKEQHNQAIKAFQHAVDMDTFTRKRALRDDLAAGKVPTPKPTQDVIDPMGIQMPNLGKGPVSAYSVNLDPTEYSSPDEFSATNPQMNFEREMLNTKLANDKTLLGIREEGENTRLNKSLISREKTSAAEIEAQKYLTKLRESGDNWRASMMAGARDAKSDENFGFNQLRDLRKHPFTKFVQEKVAPDLLGIGEIEENFKKNKMSGPDATKLVYMLIRSWDPNAVKGDEVKMMKSDAQTWRQRLGTMYDNALAVAETDGKKMFAPAVTAAAIKQIKGTLSSHVNQFMNMRNETIAAVRQRAPQVLDDDAIPNPLRGFKANKKDDDPIDVDDETFNKGTGKK